MMIIMMMYGIYLLLRKILKYIEVKSRFIAEKFSQFFLAEVLRRKEEVCQISRTFEAILKNTSR